MNYRAIDRHIGAADIGLGMLPRKTPQVFIQGADAAGKRVPIMVRRKCFDADR
jgi:hypothetical protein